MDNRERGKSVHASENVEIDFFVLMYKIELHVCESSIKIHKNMSPYDQLKPVFIIMWNYFKIKG